MFGPDHSLLIGSFGILSTPIHLRIYKRWMIFFEQPDSGCHLVEEVQWMTNFQAGPFPTETEPERGISDADKNILSLFQIYPQRFTSA